MPQSGIMHRGEELDWRRLLEASSFVRFGFLKGEGKGAECMF